MAPRRSQPRARPGRFEDPRYYQIAVLGLLLIYGLTVLDIGILWQNACVIFLGTLATQFIAAKLTQMPRFDPLSPIITSLSLTLLLRTDVTLVALVAAIASKFIVRIHGKHVFNPTNVALVLSMLFFDGAWMSSGQWCSATTGAFVLACLGSLVLS